MITVNRPTTALFGKLVTRIVWRAQVHGNSRVLYSLLRRGVLCSPLGRCARICFCDVQRWPLSGPTRVAKAPRCFDLRSAREDDVPRLQAYCGDAQRVVNRLQRGDRCLIADGRDGLGAVVWCAVGNTVLDEDRDDLDCYVHLPSGVGWVYDGKGTRWAAWGSLMTWARDFLRETGIEEIYTLLEWNNWKSLDSHASLGFERVGEVGCIRLAGACWRGCHTVNSRWRRMPGAVGRVRFSAQLG